MPLSQIGNANPSQERERQRCLLHDRTGILPIFRMKDRSSYSKRGLQATSQNLCLLLAIPQRIATPCLLFCLSRVQRPSLLTRQRYPGASLQVRRNLFHSQLGSRDPSRSYLTFFPAAFTPLGRLDQLSN